MATKKTHTARLLKLANILAKFRETRSKDETKGIRFDMQTWLTHKGEHAPEPKDGFCGTAACALGHAALDPGFRRCGLKIEWEKNVYAKFDDNGNIAGTTNDWEGTVHYRGLAGHCAGAEFFGLSHGEADDLFLGTHRTKREVVTRLRELAKDREELRCDRDWS